LADAAVARAACAGMNTVCHLAARVGGVGYNAKHHGTLFTENLAVGLNVIDAAARAGAERFLCVSSACVYGNGAAVPTPESEGFLGDPEATNFGYGWAKRALEVQARGYMQEFGMPVAIVRPYNAYGPRDNFDRERSHVIPALIRKVVEGEDPVVVWGDGSQTRSFLYVSDLVEGLLAALERYAVGDPVNLGTDEEIAMAALVQRIVELSGRHPQVVFEASRPTGQVRRLGDLTKAREQLQFSPRVALQEGLRRTMQWYAQQQPAQQKVVAA
jgi:GDP-L-fucose synthase